MVEFRNARRQLRGARAGTQAQSATAGRDTFSRNRQPKEVTLPDIPPNSAQHHPGLGPLVPTTQSPAHRRP